MRITHTPSMDRVGRMASFLFALVQMALAVGLFWALRVHIV